MNDEDQPKNATYQRALSAFFGDQQLTSDQKSSLPQDVDGLSARRQTMIQTVLDTTDEIDRLHALKLLRARFGIPQDIRIILFSLTLEDEPLAVEGLKSLEQWIEAQSLTDHQILIDWRAELTQRIERLTLRSFRDDIHHYAQRCLNGLASQ